MAGASDSAKRLAGAQLGKAFETAGFAVIEGHGVPANVLEAMRLKSNHFFQYAPEHVKHAIKAAPLHGAQGYHAQGHENVAQLLGDFSRKPDMVERIWFRNLHNPQSKGGCGASVPDDLPKFPNEDEVPGFRDALERYFDGFCDVHRTLMAMAECALELPAGYFDPFYGPNMGTSTQVANYLRQRCASGKVDAPKLDDDDDDVAFGAHTDSGGLTILSTDAPGLEVYLADGWTPVPLIDGTLVVNVGRLLSRWTNDRWLASIHRVKKPANRRLTLVSFFSPRADAIVGGLPTCDVPLYEPFLVKDFLHQRHLLHIPPEQRSHEEQTIRKEFWEAADPTTRQEA